MKKSIIIIIILISIICFSYRYLKNSIDEKKTYIFKITSKPLLYCRKQLELDDPESFEFAEYFSIISNNEYQYKYQIEPENIVISFNNERFSYPYRIKEKEKEIVTEYVIREVYVNSAPQPVVHQSQESENIHSPEGMNQPYEYETIYMDVTNSVLSFEKGTDLSYIIMSIQDCISTNTRVSVDYSSLNPNDSGDYPVYIYSDAGNDQITVKII